MITPKTTSYQKAIDAVESLPFDEREELLELLRLRIAEHRRDEIAANAEETLKAVRERQAIYGNVGDLKKNLLRE